jgi:acetone carboxylase gamma subunit
MSEATLRDPVGTAAEEGELGIGDTFVFRRDESGVVNVDCGECGHRFGPASRDPKLAACMSERSIVDLSVLNEVGMVERLVARHFFCPSCGLLFSVNVQQKGDPIMIEWSIDADTLPALA